MGTSELDTRNIAVSMKKSMENLVISSQDAIGQSISQALSFSGVISQSSGQSLLENRSVSRSPSPSLRNVENVILETIETDKDSVNLTEGLGDGDSASCIDVNYRNSDKVSSPNPLKGAEGGSRTKKKSWYSALYPTYKSRSEDFKRLFKDLPDDERLIVDYSCALQKDILAHGRLYASQNYLCFYANIFGWETSLTLRWKDVTAITKEKTALVIPNAILVCTSTEKNFLASFSGRDKAYLMLFRVWQNALMDQPMTSQEIWQWVHSCYGEELGFNSDDEGYNRDTEDEKPPPAPSLPEELLESSSMEAVGGNDSADTRHGRGHSSTPPPVGNGDGVYREVDAAETLPTDMSDTDSETEKHHKTGDVQKCCEAHDGRLLLDRQFAINIDQLFTLIFTSSEFYVKLLAARNTRDYVQEPWQHNDQSGEKCRQISYTLGLTGVPIGPKEVYVTETQVMNKCTKPGVLYSIDIKSENAGIPYADYFEVEAHYCLRRTGEGATHVLIYGQIKYKKSLWPMVKAFLEKNAIGGLEEYVSLLESRLGDEGNTAPARRKGRRRRRPISSCQESTTTAASPTTLPRCAATTLPRGGGTRDCWLPATLLVLLLINALLYWRLYHAPRHHHYDIHDLHHKLSWLSRGEADAGGAEGGGEGGTVGGGEGDTVTSQWTAVLERHARRQRSELVEWRAALDRAVASLAQTEQALTKLLETIQPPQDRTRDSNDERTDL